MYFFVVIRLLRIYAQYLFLLFCLLFCLFVCLFFAKARKAREANKANLGP